MSAEEAGRITTLRALAVTTMAYASSSLPLAQVNLEQSLQRQSWNEAKLMASFQQHQEIEAAKSARIPQPQEPTTMARTLRLVQVFIADTNEHVPVADALLHKGEPKFTDSTDQELFYELDIKGMLDAHNAKRTKMVNKSVKDRTEHLEPARVRDLKMIVTEIAKF